METQKTETAESISTAIEQLTNNPSINSEEINNCLNLLSNMFSIQNQNEIPVSSSQLQVNGKN